MTKPISDYTESELREKIESIKTEREKTIEDLKRYEEELEQRKKERPLGVPLENILTKMPYDAVSKNFSLWFSSEESADKFIAYFANYIRALQTIAEGKPIGIKVLLPLLRKGWVAMDEDGTWYWYPEKPEQTLEEWIAVKPAVVLSTFNLKPAEDWRESLMECGL